MVRDRAARHAKVAGQIELIIAEVDQLERDQKWAAALTAARRAEAVLAGADTGAATTQRVRDRLKDLEFIDRLEQIRMQRATWSGGDVDHPREYAYAFREHGVDIEAFTVETSIARLRRRPALAIPIAAALDDWVHSRHAVLAMDVADWKPLVAVARGIDPDPLRDRIRSYWGRTVSRTNCASSPNRSKFGRNILRRLSVLPTPSNKVGNQTRHSDFYRIPICLPGRFLDQF